MQPERVNEINRLMESCRETDNGELEAENAAGVGESLAQRILQDAAEHGSMTGEEIDGLLKSYEEANESLLECEEPREWQTEIED